MPDNQNTNANAGGSKSANAEVTPAASKGAGDPSQYGKRVEDAGRQADEAKQAANTVAEKATQASAEAARLNEELLKANVQIGREAGRAGWDAGMRTFEGLASSLSRTFGIATPNPQLAEESSRNLQAVSQAGVALARGAQEASRVWFDIAQQGVRTNVQALSQLAGCRTLQDVVVVQSHLVRENLQRLIEGGQTIARSSAHAMEEADRAMHPTQSIAADRR